MRVTRNTGIRAAHDDSVVDALHRALDIHHAITAVDQRHASLWEGRRGADATRSSVAWMVIPAAPHERTVGAIKGKAAAKDTHERATLVITTQRADPDQ